MQRETVTRGWLAVLVLVVGCWILVPTASADPPVRGRWEVEEIEPHNVHPRASSLDLDANDLPHLSYASFYREWDGTRWLKHAYKEWLEGDWQIEDVMPEDALGPIEQTMIRIVDGEPHIYVGCANRLSNRTIYSVKHVYREGQNWFDELVGSEIRTSLSASFKFTLDGQNTPHVVMWEFNLNGGTDLYYIRLDGSSWTTHLVDTATDEQLSFGVPTAIAIAGDNYAHIAYATHVNSQSRVNYVRGDGSSWPVREVVADPEFIHDAQSIQIALDSENTPHVTYSISSWGEPLSIFYAYREAPSSWWQEQVDTADHFNDYRLIVDANNNAHIAYYVSDDLTVRYARWNGRSFSLEVVEDTNNYINGLFFATNSYNVPHLSYWGSRDGLKYAYRVPPPGEDCWEITESRITNDPGISKFPSLVWAGTEYGVTWKDERDDEEGEIFFARIDTEGNKIEDDGRITDDPEKSHVPSLVWTGTNYGVVWNDWRDRKWEVYFARMDTDGNEIEDEVRITHDSVIGNNVDIAWNSRDNEYGVAFWSARGGNNQIYFTRIGADGTKRGDDVRITVDPADSLDPSLVWNSRDNEYGVAWIDWRDENTEVYFARLNADGSKIGGDVRITDNPRDTLDPSLVWTGTEYGVAWEDTRDRNGGTEIYFARINAGGSKRGEDVRITDASGHSGHPSLVWAETEYGVAWSDDRDGNSAIYFANINTNGDTVGVDIRINRIQADSYRASLVWTGTEYGVAWFSVLDENREIYFATFKNICQEQPAPLLLFSGWEELTGIAGGSVLALAVHPQNSDTVYAGTYRRGLYRRVVVEGRETWEPRSEQIRSMTVDVIEVDPRDRDTIYIHAHDGAHNWLLKSEDGGNTFSLRWEWTPPDGQRARITAIAVDRNNPEHVLVGFDRAFFTESTNGGESWDTSWINEGETDGVGCLYAEQSQRGRGDILVAGFKNPGDGARALYKSGNGGESWGGYTGNLPRGSSGDFFLATRGYDRDDYFTKYLVSNGTRLDRRGVFRRKWKIEKLWGFIPIDPVLGDTEWHYTGGPGSDLGDEERIITAFAGNPYHLIGGISQEEKGRDRNNLIYRAGVVNPNSGGEVRLENWALRNNGIHQDVIVSALGCGQSRNPTLFCGTANNTLDDGYLPGPGGDGIYRSTNLGTSWQESNENLLNAAITAIAGNSELLYAGTVTGEIWESRDAGESWIDTTDLDYLDPLGTIKDIRISADGEVAYALSERNLCVRPHNFFLPLWSPVVGNTSGLPETPGAIAPDPTAPGVVYAGVDGDQHGVYRSMNHGANWQWIAGDDPASAAIAVSPSRWALYGVGSREGYRGKIYRSTDGGTSWPEVYDTGVTIYEEAHITIAGEGGRGELVYVSIGGNLYLSRNGGTDWQNVTSFEHTTVDIALPFGGRFTLEFPVEITAVKTDTARDDLVFVAVGDLFNTPVAEGGVYYGIDDGNDVTFYPLKNGLRTLDVTAFTLSPGEGEDDSATLYCGLLCGGIYRSTYGEMILFPWSPFQPSYWWIPEDEASEDDASQSGASEDGEKDDGSDKGGAEDDVGTGEGQWFLSQYSEQQGLAVNVQPGEDTGIGNSNSQWFLTDYSTRLTLTTTVEIGQGTALVNSNGQLFLTDYSNQLVLIDTGIFVGSGEGQYFLIQYSENADLSDIHLPEDVAGIIPFSPIPFELEPPNRAPVIEPIPAQKAIVGETVKLLVTASDPDDDELNYSLVEGPNGAAIDPSTGVFSWTPGTDDAGTHTVTIGTSDGSLDTSGTFSITVKAKPSAAITSPDAETPVEGIVSIVATVENMERPYYALFYINGRYKGYAWGVGRQEYSYKWNTTREVGKEFTITTRVYDLKTRQWYSSEPVTVKRREPGIVIISPPGSSTVEGTVPITVKTEHMVQSYYAVFYVNGRYRGYAWGVGKKEYTYNWNTAKEQGTQATITARVYDLTTRQWYSAEPVTVRKAEVKPPAVTITPPAGGSPIKGTVSIALQFENLGSDRAYQASYYIDGKKAGWRRSPFDYTWDTKTIANGTHTLQARVILTPSNKTITAGVVSVTVDNQPEDKDPGAANIVSLQEGSTITGIKTVSLNTSNIKDRIYEVRFYYEKDGKKNYIWWDRTPPYSVSWDTRKASGKLGNGDYHLLAEMTLLKAGYPRVKSNALRVVVEN